MKLFVDTNIFLDLILKRDGYKESIIILNAIEKKIYDGVILDITILNIDYIAKKQVRDIREFLILINSICEIIGASNSMIGTALEIKNNDLEDNLQYTCAKKTKCDLIITNDKNFYSQDIELLSGLEFIDKYIEV